MNGSAPIDDTTPAPPSAPPGAESVQPLPAPADALTLLVVDDEPLARERVRTFLAEVPDVEIVGERVKLNC